MWRHAFLKRGIAGTNFPNLVALQNPTRLFIPSSLMHTIAEPPSFYRPLDAAVPEIRVFVLEPSQDPASPLVGQLQTVSLASPPPYEGLSYTWGKPDRTKPVIIDGQTLLVTPNLEVALCGLRRQDAQRTLWIDAICINQESLHERGQQVALMGRIYARCVRDLLWLGPLSEEETKSWSPGEETIGRGFDLLKRIVDRDGTILDPMEKGWTQHRRRVKKWGYSYYMHDDYDPELELSNEGQEEELQKDQESEESKSEDDETDGPAIKHMLESEDQEALESAFSWPEVWHRLWVMQELSLAPKVQLVTGAHTLDWDVVTKFLGDSLYADAFHGTFSHGSIDSIRYWIFENIQIIDHQRRIMKDVQQIEGAESKLLDVLARFRETRCLDPRDKIFGLLGLVTDYKDIRIDYSKSPEQVYTDVTVSLINHARNLDILCQSPWHSMQDSRWTKDSVENRPSWAADFMTKGEVILFAQRSIFTAGRATCEVPCRVVDGTILGARGVVLGRVGKVLQEDHLQSRRSNYIPGRYDTKSHLPLDWMRMYLGNDILNKESEARYVTGESAFTAFWRTLVVDSAAYPIVRLDPQRIQDEDKLVREEWSQFLQSATREQLETSHSSREYFSDPEIERMWVNTYGQWSFTILENGLYALIMPQTVEGDIIATLDGAKVPVVLRPVKHDSLKNTFQVITIAYVHGFMDTEASESEHLRGKLGLRDEEFWLV